MLASHVHSISRLVLCAKTNAHSLWRCLGLFLISLRYLQLESEPCQSRWHGVNFPLIVGKCFTDRTAPCLAIPIHPLSEKRVCALPRPTRTSSHLGNTASQGIKGMVDGVGVEPTGRIVCYAYKCLISVTPFHFFNAAQVVVSPTVTLLSCAIP